MTVTVKELLGKLELLREIMKKRDKALREETDHEASHILFLEQNLASLTHAVDSLRNGRKSTHYKSVSKRGGSPLGFTGQSTLKNSVHPGLSNLAKIVHHKRGNFSGDWQEFVPSKRGKEKLFTSQIEYPLSTLRNQASTSTLQKNPKGRTGSYLSNIYTHQMSIRPTELNQPKILDWKEPEKPQRKKFESHRSNIGAGSLSENRKYDLEQSRSMVRFNYQPPQIHSEFSGSAKHHLASPQDVSPHLPYKKNSITSEVIQASEAKNKKSFSKSLKKPPVIQTSTFGDDDLNPFKTEANPAKLSANKLASLSKGGSMHLETGLSSKVNLLNLRRRDTLGAKPITPLDSNKGAFLSPSKLKHKTPIHRTEVQLIPRDTVQQTNTCWSKNKNSQNKLASQDASSGFGTASANASKLLNDLLRARNKYNHDRKSSKLSHPMKTSMCDLSSTNRNLSNIDSLPHDDTVRIEEDSDKKTEKKSSPVNRTHLDVVSDSPYHQAQNIVLKEVSHRSDFISESVSIIADTSQIDN